MKNSRAPRRVPSVAVRAESSVPSVPSVPGPPLRAPLLPGPLLPRPLPVVGRETQLDTLTARLGAVGRSGAELVVLTGPTGVGKTALLATFAERARRAGHTVLEARCERHRAYAPFASLVQQAMDRLRKAGRPAPPETRWLTCADGCCRFWFEHEVHGEDAAPGQARASVAARERRNRFFAAVQQLLSALAPEGPPLLLLHELQDADEATRELLAYLLDAGRDTGRAIGPGWGLPALFVATAPNMDALGALEDATRVTSLPLRGLDVGGVAALLGSPAIAGWVHERTEGSPERVLELLSAPAPEPGALVVAALGALSTEARQLLEAVAVVERPMPLAWLEELLDLAVAPPTVESLVQLQLLERTRAPQRGRLALARPSLRAGILASTEPARRRRLHLRCAARFADGSGPAAMHALAAGNAERAAQLALKEARALHARHAAAQGAVLLERVLDAGCSPPRKAELRRALADLYGSMGHYADALPHAQATAAESPDAPDATLRLGRLLGLAGRRREALETVLAAHAQAVAAGDVDQRVAAEAELAELHQLGGEPEEARRWVKRALDGAVGRTLPNHELAAWNTLGKVAFAAGDLAEARDIFARATARAMEADIPHRTIQGLINQAVASVALGELEAAEPLLASAVDHAEEVGSADGLALGTHNLALLAHLRRNYREALHLYRRAAAETRVVGNEGLLVQVAVNLGELYLTLGDHDQARSTLAFARRHIGADLSVYFRRNLGILDARIERARGDVERARAALDGASELAEGASFELGVERARVALMAGHLDDAAAALATLPPAELTKDDVERCILEAQLAIARGRGTRAAADALLAAAQDLEDDERGLDAHLTAAEAYLAVGERSLAAPALQAARRCEARLAEQVPRECATAWLARPHRRRLDALSAPGELRALPRGSAQRAPSPELQGRFPAIVGRSPAVAQLLRRIDRVSASTATVLIRGESGTGKELVAEALHRESPRAGQPLVKVNCAALVETLLLSELFGHERGAFSGATARRKGRFETADGGTLFLDEIGDISPKTQVALLRVLQERTFERVGGTTTLSVDVRILAATHQDLEALVAAGRFRQDLYYRLRGIEIRTPPLRARRSDLPDLIGCILGRVAKETGALTLRCTPEVLAALAAHDWPGNVRELENVLRAAAYFAEDGVLDMGSLQAVHAPCLESRTPGLATSPEDPGRFLYARVRRGELSLADMKKELERECIESALVEVSGNISAAARLLGMKRPRLSQLVKEHGLRGVATRGKAVAREVEA